MDEYNPKDFPEGDKIGLIFVDFPTYSSFKRQRMFWWKS
jgi:hypothetical protein